MNELNKLLSGGTLGSFCGMKVISSEWIPEKQPKIQLSNKVTVSPEFRAKCDAWYLEMFGEESVAYLIGENFAMNPKNVAALKLAR